jgi:N-acetyl-1-D-myo-inositol-2-amino-2-deoxy-alpha-D-glucopyranoside deacetylase
MRAHETQITVDGEYFALSNDLGQRILGREYCTQLAGPRGPRGPRTTEDTTEDSTEVRYERDLFAR